MRWHGVHVMLRRLFRSLRGHNFRLSGGSHIVKGVACLVKGHDDSIYEYWAFPGERMKECKRCTRTVVQINMNDEGEEPAWVDLKC